MNDGRYHLVQIPQLLWTGDCNHHVNVQKTAFHSTLSHPSGHLHSFCDPRAFLWEVMWIYHSGICGPSTNCLPLMATASFLTRLRTAAAYGCLYRYLESSYNSTRFFPGAWDLGTLHIVIHSKAFFPHQCMSSSC